MTERSINYGLAYGICIGVVVAITYGIALESLAIGISIGLGSGITLVLHYPKQKINKGVLTQFQANKNSLTFVWFFVCGMMVFSLFLNAPIRCFDEHIIYFLRESQYQESTLL